MRWQRRLRVIAQYDRQLAPVDGAAEVAAPAVQYAVETLEDENDGLSVEKSEYAVGALDSEGAAVPEAAMAEIVETAERESEEER